MKINTTRAEWDEKFTLAYLHEFGTPFAGIPGPSLIIVGRSLIENAEIEDYMLNLTTHDASLLVIVEDA